MRRQRGGAVHGAASRHAMGSGERTDGRLAGRPTRRLGCDRGGAEARSRRGSGPGARGSAGVRRPVATPGVQAAGVPGVTQP
eukprot:2409806-Alexandrium_andersonii.AAC.1